MLNDSYLTTRLILHIQESIWLSMTLFRAMCGLGDSIHGISGIERIIELP